MAVGERLGSASKPAKATRREGYPELTPAFTWVTLFLGIWGFLGSVVDINAHNHGFVDETFLTPFHFLMYSGVAANGLFYVIMQYRNVGRGHSLMKALPKEYLLSFVGVLVFGIGGVFDLFWHEIFGFEAGVDALVSPSHLVLLVGGMLFISGRCAHSCRRAGARAAGQSSFRRSPRRCSCSLLAHFSHSTPTSGRSWTVTWCRKSCSTACDRCMPTPWRVC